MHLAHLIFQILWVAGVVSALPNARINTNHIDLEVTLDNGYVQVVVNRLKPSISSISADFSGKGNYSVNALSNEFTLETILPNERTIRRCADSSSASPLLLVTQNSTSRVEIEISDIFDCPASPVASEKWIISLEQGQRFADVRVVGSIVKPTEVISIGHTVYSASSSVNGLFDSGVAQMMQSDGACLGSTSNINRAYFVGNGAALDLLKSNNGGDQSSSSSSSVVLFSKRSEVSPFPFVSGFQDVIFGNFPYESSESLGEPWSDKCWSNAAPTAVHRGQSWDLTFQFGPNNADFPIYGLPEPADALYNSSAFAMPYIDVQTFLTGAYAAAAGCVQSFYHNRDGTIAPTVSHPDVGCSPDTNFFDPDNYITLSAMLYSGDIYLWEEVRKVLERTAQTMCGTSGTDQIAAYCDVAVSDPSRSRVLPAKVRRRLEAADSSPRTGQVMHHFVNLVPTYESIAGSEQLGPNIFWTLCALKYASMTSDLAWLNSMFEFVDKSALFLTTFYDEGQGMMDSPGPLWIDVLVRENYTSDSNAIAPMVLTSIADCFDVLDAYRVVNNLPAVAPSVSADELRAMADSITENMNRALWSESDNDHYITQVDPNGDTRDFIDYDANLLAVAFGVAPDERVASILKRVDSGPYTHVRATWCCEVQYSGDREDCYIVGGTVCGDSVVTLARIGWADAHARKRVRDAASLDMFNNVLLAPLQNDVVADTWLYERYDADGNQIRTAYYFEYPSLVTMLLTEIRYGVNFGLNSVSVDPFPAQDFIYAFGAIKVFYSKDSVMIDIPGKGTEKQVEVTGLRESTQYYISFSGDGCGGSSSSSHASGGVVLTDAAGTARTSAIMTAGCALRLDITAPATAATTVSAESY